MKSINYLLLIVVFGCTQNTTSNLDFDNFEYFPLYTSKDVTIESGTGSTSSTYVPVIDSMIQMPKDLELENKLNIIAKNVSARYFGGKEIKILKIDSLAFPKTVHLELYDGFYYGSPESTKTEEDLYKGWYLYFQGSSGGWVTEITLKENFLQKTYKGDWIDVLVFYWQGEEMVVWDHIDLAGPIKRYN